MDVIQILEKLQSFGFVRLHKVINEYYQIYCPFHNNGNERKPSCGVLLHEQYKNGRRYPQGWVHCFTCGYFKPLPDAITDILKSKSISKSGMDWLVENIPGFEAEDGEFDLLIPDNLMKDIQNKYALDYIQKQIQPKHTSYVSEEELASYRFTVPYMYERKLTDELIEKFDIGVDMNWVPPGRKKVVPCLTFPVRDRCGNTLFICRRSIEGKFFSIPKEVTKPVYGIDMIPSNCKSVVICESILNCLTCWRYGYPAVALLGTGNSYQIQQLRELGVYEYVICMDGDEAGERATNKLKRALNGVALIWVIHMIEGKDVNDLDKSQFEELYNNRE